MTGLNNEMKHALVLSDNVPQQFQEFVAFLQWLDNWFKDQEVEKKDKSVPQTTNNTLQALPTTHASSTTTGIQPVPMDLSANWRTLTPVEYQKMILKGSCLYCGVCSYVAQACPN
jgi:type II secretory pathway component PulM